MAEPDGKDGKFWYRTSINAFSEASPFLFLMRDSFSRMKSFELQLRSVVFTLREMNASLDFISERVKNNERAKEYRNSGNDLFLSRENTSKAAEMYTKSIAYALPGSRELALAYANRSAVSFKTEDYDGCLLDIERSLENNYPEEMRAKLYARRVRCLVALEKPQADIEKALQETKEALLMMNPKANGRDLVEKTLTDDNHMAPTISTKKTINRLKPTVPQDDNCDIRGATGVSIQYSKKYGRHLVATRDVRPGEIIAVIDAYASARTPEKCYRECSHCINSITAGIPCDHCVNVIYCSISCRDKAWNDYHEFECPILGILLDLEISSTALLGIKMTLKALREAGSVVELKKMLKRIDSVSDPRIRGFTDNVLDCTKYACIYTLASHRGDHIVEIYIISITSIFAVYYLATRTDIFGKKYPTGFEVFDKIPLLGFLGALIMKNCEIVNNTGCGIGDDVQIAPFTALCNHSCDSNVTYTGTNKSVVFALQPIKAGDQIWDTYGDQHYSRFPKAEREINLKNLWLFTCDCVACINNWPVIDKLPRAREMLALLSPKTHSLLSELEKTFWKKYRLSITTGDMLAAMDELVQLIELLFEHARPSKEIIFYRQLLIQMYSLGLDLF